MSSSSTKIVPRSQSNTLVSGMKRMWHVCCQEFTCQQLRIEHDVASGLCNLKIPVCEGSDRCQLEIHVSRLVSGKVINRKLGEPGLKFRALLFILKRRPRGLSEMIEVTNEKVAVAWETLKEAQTLQKAYPTVHRTALEFSSQFSELIPIRSESEDLTYTEDLAILDRHDRVMRNKTIPFGQQPLRNHPEREAHLGTEESYNTGHPYPHFLPKIWYDHFQLCHVSNSRSTNYSFKR
ncbi:hypothetical protein Tco_0870247 [Tanacetum coccineum]